MRKERVFTWWTISRFMHYRFQTETLLGLQRDLQITNNSINKARNEKQVVHFKMFFVFLQYFLSEPIYCWERQKARLLVSVSQSASVNAALELPNLAVNILLFGFFPNFRKWITVSSSWNIGPYSYRDENIRKQISSVENGNLHWEGKIGLPFNTFWTIYFCCLRSVKLECRKSKNGI